MCRCRNSISNTSESSRWCRYKCIVIRSNCSITRCLCNRNLIGCINTRNTMICVSSCSNASELNHISNLTRNGVVGNSESCRTVTSTNYTLIKIKSSSIVIRTAIDNFCLCDCSTSNSNFCSCTSPSSCLRTI